MQKLIIDETRHRKKQEVQYQKVNPCGYNLSKLDMIEFKRLAFFRLCYLRLIGLL